MKFSEYLKQKTHYPASRTLCDVLDRLEEQDRLWEIVNSNNLKALKMYFMSWKGI